MLQLLALTPSTGRGFAMFTKRLKANLLPCLDKRIREQFLFYFIFIFYFPPYKYALLYTLG